MTHEGFNSWIFYYTSPVKLKNKTAKSIVKNQISRSWYSWYSSSAWKRTVDTTSAMKGRFLIISKLRLLKYL